MFLGGYWPRGILTEDIGRGDIGQGDLGLEPSRPEGAEIPVVGSHLHFHSDGF